MWLNLIRFKQQYLFASQALLMVFSATTRDKTDDGKEPPDAGGGKQQRMSFRDMVMGRKEAPPSRLISSRRVWRILNMKRVTLSSQK